MDIYFDYYKRLYVGSMPHFLLSSVLLFLPITWFIILFFWHIIYSNAFATSLIDDDCVANTPSVRCPTGHLPVHLQPTGTGHHAVRCTRATGPVASQPLFCSLLCPAWLFQSPPNSLFVTYSRILATFSPINNSWLQRFRHNSQSAYNN